MGRDGVVRPVAIGAAVGIGYAVCLRAWMRLITTDPEFTWTGTGCIVEAFSVLGGMAGLVTAGRRLGWRWRLLAARIAGISLGLGCFVAAGVLMFPTVVPAAPGWGRTDWPRMVRVTLILLGAVAAAIVVLTFLAPGPGSESIARP